MIKEHDHKLDRRVLDDFLKFIGYSDKEFWKIVEKFWNKNLYSKEGIDWTPKPVITENLME
jgi:hypothetical protein